MSDQGGDTRIELMFRLEAALKRIEALEAALREIARQAAAPERRCAKCGCTTKGEEALVGGEIWCHPCADRADLAPERDK